MGLVSFGCGKSNTLIQGDLDSYPTTAYYDVWGYYNSINIPNEPDPEAPSNDTTPEGDRITRRYRFILDCKEGRDYEHIQLSWVNSYGFRDYWTFRKRNEESYSIQRNTFDKLEGTYDGTTFSVSNTDRGITQYNTSVNDNYSALTG